MAGNSDSSSSPPAVYRRGQLPILKIGQQSKLQDALEQNEHKLNTLKQIYVRRYRHGSTIEHEMVESANEVFKTMRNRIKGCEDALKESQKGFYENAIVKYAQAVKRSHISCEIHKKKRTTAQDR